jgi:hypothetical protein
MDAVIDKLPAGSQGFTFVDVAAMRGDDALKVYYDRARDEIESDCDFLGISASDVDRMIDDEIDGHDLRAKILEGRFNIEDVGEDLRQNGWAAQLDYKGVETWQRQSGFYQAVALANDACIVVASGVDSMEACIDAIKGDADSLADDEDVAAVADKLPSGIHVQVATGAESISRTKKDSDTLIITIIEVYANEETAEDARIEWGDGSDSGYNNTKVTRDGRFVILTAEWGIY